MTRSILMIIVATWLFSLHAAEERARENAAFIASLGLFASGPTCVKRLEFKTPDGEVIGSITYGVFGSTAVCEPTGSIEHLEVDTRFRRRGVGSALFQTAIDDMRTQACKHISWQATEESLPFYAQQGATYRYAEGTYHGMGIEATEELSLPASRLSSIKEQHRNEH